MQLQLVTPHMHWHSTSERSVRTLNNHFISALCTVNPHLTFYLWYHLLPQVTMKFNMLRQYQLNPGLLSYKKVDVV